MDMDSVDSMDSMDSIAGTIERELDLRYDLMVDRRRHTYVAACSAAQALARALRGMGWHPEVDGHLVRVEAPLWAVEEAYDRIHEPRPGRWTVRRG